MSEDKKQKLESQLWNIANTLRGKMDADDFRDYWNCLKTKRVQVSDIIGWLKMGLRLPKGIFLIQRDYKQATR